MKADSRQASAPDPTEKVLVNQAKEYLRQRLQKLAPDAVLTQSSRNVSAVAFSFNGKHIATMGA
jgi:hypothetical protein